MPEVQTTLFFRFRILRPSGILSHLFLCFCARVWWALSHKGPRREAFLLFAVPQLLKYSPTMWEARAQIPTLVQQAWLCEVPHQHQIACSRKSAYLSYPSTASVPLRSTPLNIHWCGNSKPNGSGSQQAITQAFKPCYNTYLITYIQCKYQENTFCQSSRLLVGSWHVNKIEENKNED